MVAASRIPKDKVPIGPQPGPQNDFLRNRADIIIYGGAAGGGKTHGLLLEAARKPMQIKNFSSIIFRREFGEITAPGGLWEASERLYPLLGLPQPHLGNREWSWRGAGKARFAGLQHATDVYKWMGSELPMIGFDELTRFTGDQFWFMLSRNRSTTGVPPYVRATCNPDADSWVAEFIAWWIDQETGFFIPERAGALRYYVRVAGNLLWADDPAELMEHLPAASELPPGVEMPKPKSVTFIPAKLSDNPALLRANPEYLLTLHSMPLVEQQRLLYGNWKIRPAAGLFFQRSKCTFIDAAPAGLRKVRYWDLAGTMKTESNDPDWTVGVLMGRDEAGFLYILDVQRARVDPFEVEKLLASTASSDGKFVNIGFGHDPGQAGNFQASSHIRNTFAGYNATAKRESGEKTTRFGPFSAQALAGNVRILKASWNDVFCRALEGFPDLAHDDDVDACSGAYEMLLNGAGVILTGPIIETTPRTYFGSHPGA